MKDLRAAFSSYKITIANGKGTCSTCCKPIKKKSNQLLTNVSSFPIKVTRRDCKCCAEEVLAGIMIFCNRLIKELNNEDPPIKRK